MKKISLLVVLLAFLFVLAGIVGATDYCVQVETYPIAAQSTTTIAAVGYPHISGGAKIESLVFANAGDTVQTVDLYELSSSSLTASVICTVVLASTGTVQVDFPYDTPLTHNDVAAIKSATGSVVDLTYVYR